MRWLRFSLLLGAVCLMSCRSGEVSHNANATPSPAPGTSVAEVKSKIDVCGLLSRDDLKEVQGEAYQDAQRSDRLDGNGLIVAQCYYALPTTVNSVVVTVTTAKDEAHAGRPKTFWTQNFLWAETVARSKEGKGKGEREQEKSEREKSKPREPGERRPENEAEETTAPQRIKDLGDEAVWMGNAIGGALYVLKNDQIVRVSVGGEGDQKTKLNKSKTLAQMMLKKL